MRLKAGERLKSVVGGGEFVVVKPATGEIDLRCAGRPVVALDADVPEAAEIDPLHADGTALGKRYVDVGSGLELLVTKAGQGSLSTGDIPLQRKDAKPLPSSD